MYKVLKCLSYILISPSSLQEEYLSLSKQINPLTQFWCSINLYLTAKWSSYTNISLKEQDANLSPDKAANAIIGLDWSFNIFIVLCCFKLQILIVLSADPDANLSFLNKHKALTPLKWPFNINKQFPSLSNILMELS